MTQKRDSNGKFAKCKIRAFKNGVRGWWNTWKSDLKAICTILFVIWIIVTGIVWILGSKEVEVCYNHTAYVETTPAYFTGESCPDYGQLNPGYYWYDVDPSNCTIVNPVYSTVEQRECYQTTVYGQNTLPDTIILEGKWVWDTIAWFATKKII